MHFPNHNPARDCTMITQLNDYIDGALPPDLCAEIEAHLAGCPDCRVVLDTLDWTVRILHNVDIVPPPLPAGVEARLLAHMTQRIGCR